MAARARRKGRALGRKLTVRERFRTSRRRDAANPSLRLERRARTQPLRRVNRRSLRSKQHRQQQECTDDDPVIAKRAKITGLNPAHEPDHRKEGDDGSDHEGCGGIDGE